MIQLDFYGHIHPYSPSLATLTKRVELHTNVLDSTYTHLGCAARISKDSYQACTVPFGRFVQNFGALKSEIVK